MMDIQTIIAGLIILIAVAYAAMVLLRKTKAFSPRSTCVDDCGCSSKSKPAKVVH
jgi:hypothetical protein